MASKIDPMQKEKDVWSFSAATAVCRKQLAVQEEDYDTAKAIKAEIAQVRAGKRPRGDLSAQMLNNIGIDFSRREAGLPAETSGSGSTLTFSARGSFIQCYSHPSLQTMMEHLLLQPYTLDAKYLV